jgi:hypothetical protein
VPDRAHTIDSNPYAASAVAEPRTSDSPHGAGVWHYGYFVVMHCDAVLPPVCFKSGEPAEFFVDCWPNPILSLLRRLPLGPKVRIPMTRRQLQRSNRTSCLLLAGGIVLLLLGVGAYSHALVDRRFSGLMPFVFLQWSISLLIAGVASRRLVPAQRRGD